MQQVSLRIILYKAGAEFIGLFFFIFALTSANGDNFVENTVMGTAIMLAMQHSGALFNPAVNLCFYLRKRITLREAIIYSIVQIVGAFFASCMAHFLLGMVLAPGFHEGDTWELMELVLNEVVFSFLLLFFIHIQITPETAFTDQTIFTGLLFMILLHTVRTESVQSGSVLNPAFGISFPLVAKIFNDDYPYLPVMWTWIVPPMVGSLLAWVLFQFVYYPQAMRIKPLK